MQSLVEGRLVGLILGTQKLVRHSRGGTLDPRKMQYFAEDNHYAPSCPP